MDKNQFLSKSTPILKKHNLSDWKIAFSRMNSAIAVCKEKIKTIKFDSYWVENMSWEELKDVLLHEIAHALTPGHRHDSVWKEMARKIGVKAEFDDIEMSESTKRGKFQKILELAWVPKPFYSNLEWAMAKALVNNPALQENLPMVDHVLDELEMTQHRIDRNKVNALAEAGTTDGGLCFVREGKKYIWDGHHRYLAARKLGRMTCSMKTFVLTDRHTLDVDAYEGMPVESMASQLRCRVGTLLRAMDSSDRRVFETEEDYSIVLSGLGRYGTHEEKFSVSMSVEAIDKPDLVLIQEKIRSKFPKMNSCKVEIFHNNQSIKKFDYNQKNLEGTKFGEALKGSKSDE